MVKRTAYRVYHCGYTCFFHVMATSREGVSWCQQIEEYSKIIYFCRYSRNVKFSDESIYSISRYIMSIPI